MLTDYGEFMFTLFLEIGCQCSLIACSFVCLFVFVFLPSDNEGTLIDHYETDCVYHPQNEIHWTFVN